ncbi:dihydrodipicolinate synthase family protein [Oceanomicrobium pacificus]|uniref:Dihydrodipicolinate synthase family protein n=1 Tax=Oceanomicrobium pacificus TaxID=2692916 RepID=A0A6B0TTV3_9RHOB|nr:dihydrodipicolinate synthase family protein [Oceanomicrobium pacificus]MXU65078.1 dihydrodipicolinate synthase family protein [Oceanomicrobium pacificus]
MTLRGCFPVLCTPFNDDGSVAPDDFDNVIDFCLSVDVDGVVFPGVASEVDTLSADERAMLVDRLGRRVKGRVPFIVGASDADPAGVARHLESGTAAGAAGAMVMAPGVAGKDLAAQDAFFAAVTGAATIPVMLQNAPVPIGAGLPPEDVARLAARDGIDYVKEETMPCGQNLTRIADAAGASIKGVFGGAGGRYITDELARGSLGTLPASELADLHVRLVRAWAAGDEAEARRLFMVTMPLLNFQAIFRMDMTKTVLKARGVISATHVRGKGPRMDTGDRAELFALLDQIAPELNDYELAPRKAAE